MTETRYDLQQSYTVTIGANGTAVQGNVGPTSPNERWVINNTSITATGQCTFQSFRTAQPDAGGRGQIDYTRLGVGNSSDTVIKLQQGQQISFRWTNGAAGVIATVTITGERFIKGRRAY